VRTVDRDSFDKVTVVLLGAIAIVAVAGSLADTRGASVTAAGSAAIVGSTVAPPLSCTFGDLVADYYGGGLGGGNDFGVVRIRNVAAQPCVFTGSAEVAGVDKAGRVVTQTVTYTVRGTIVLTPHAEVVPDGQNGPPPGVVEAVLILGANYRDDPTTPNGLCQNTVVPTAFRVSLAGGARTVANVNHSTPGPNASAFITCRGQLNTPNPILPE
jgi:hypothetical protein